jgi:hypothetical protein
MAPAPPSFLYPTPFFLMLTTVIIYRYLYNLKKPDFFVQFYLATMAFKLLIYGGYVATIILLDEEQAYGNVLFFLAGYLIFTGLEVGFLYSRINSNRGPDEG